MKLFVSASTFILLFTQLQYSEATCGSTYECSQKAVEKLTSINESVGVLSQNSFDSLALMNKIVDSLLLELGPSDQLQQLIDYGSYLKSVSTNQNFLFFLDRVNTVFSEPCRYIATLLCRQLFIIDGKVIEPHSSLEFEYMHKMFVYLNQSIDCVYALKAEDLAVGKAPLLNVRRCQLQSNGSRPCESHWCCEYGNLPYLVVRGKTPECYSVSGLPPDCREYPVFEAMFKIRGQNLSYTDTPHRTIGVDEACPSHWKIPFITSEDITVCGQYPLCSEFLSCDGSYRCK